MQCQVGAEIIPGDRDVRITMQRYLWKARYLAYKKAGKMQKPGQPLQIGTLLVLHPYPSKLASIDVCHLHKIEGIHLRWGLSINKAGLCKSCLI